MSGINIVDLVRRQISAFAINPMRVIQLICAALTVFAFPAWADFSRDDAVEVAQRVIGGRVLSVEKTDVGGRPVWRVKVITTQGEVSVILVDVVSGKTL